MNRAPALLVSAALHAGLLAAFVAWPEAAEPPEPPPVPVRLIPPPPDGPAEVSTAPEPSPEPPVPEPAPDLAPEPPAASTPPAPTPAPPTPSPPRPTPPRPSPRPPTPAPTPRPAPAKPAPAKPTPPRPAPRPAEQPLDLSALGDRLARNGPRRPAPAARPAGASPGELASARAELSQRLQRLWRPNCGPEGSLAVNVRVRFRLNGGRIQGAPELVGGRSDDPVLRAAQERALAAVRAAAPYDWLPAEMQDGDYQPRFNAEQACG